MADIKYDKFDKDSELFKINYMDDQRSLYI